MTIFEVLNGDAFHIDEIHAKDYFNQKDQRTDKFFIEMKTGEIMNLYRDYINDKFNWEIVSQYLGKMEELYASQKLTNFHAVTEDQFSKSN